MTDRSLPLRGPMIRALLDGRKTQHRVPLKPPYGTLEYLPNGTWRPICTKFFPGDRLWVREAHALVPSSAYRMSEGVAQALDPQDRDRACVYREGWELSKPGSWRPSIHMPRWASRLTLIVTDVRVQRVQEIIEADAVAEGVEPFGHGAAFVQLPDAKTYSTTRGCFAVLWDHIHGPGAWAANPWVCAITFDVHHRNIDAMVQA